LSGVTGGLAAAATLNFLLINRLALSAMDSSSELEEEEEEEAAVCLVRGLPLVCGVVTCCLPSSLSLASLRVVVTGVFFRAATGEMVGGSRPSLRAIICSPLSASSSSSEEELLEPAALLADRVVAVVTDVVADRVTLVADVADGAMVVDCCCGLPQGELRPTAPATALEGCDKKLKRYR
jgi:hypothetical protein